MPQIATGKDEAAERERLLTQLRTAIQTDVSGKLSIDAATHGVAFDAGRITFTPGRAAVRDGALGVMYQLTAIQAGTTSLPLGALDAPPVSVRGDTLYYERGSGVVEWYRSRTDGLEQGFTLQSLPPLDGDLVIVGSFSTLLQAELLPRREGVLFRLPATRQAVLRYGHVLVKDSAGRRTLAELDARGNQIAIRVAQTWFAQATYPVTIDPLLQEVQIAGSNAAYPDVAYGSSTQEYLVVWDDWRSGNDNIYGQRTTLTGTLKGNNFSISTAANNQTAPSVAYGSAPNQYLAVWQDRRNGTAEQVYGQRVSITGTLVGSNFIISATTSAQEYPDVTYNATTGEYLVAWQENGLIYARRVLSNGTATGAGVLVSHENGQPPASGFAERPALAYHPDDQQYLAAWDDTRDDALGDIFVQRVSITGTRVGANTAVMSTTLDEFYPGLAYNPVSREYLVAAIGGSFDNILARRVSSQGVAVGSVITVATPTAQSQDFTRPAVAVESDGDYAVIWSDRDRVGLQRILSTGSLLGSVVVVDDSAYATDVSLAYGSHDNSHLVTWSDNNALYANVFRPVDADFSASPVQGSAPLTVTFTNTSQPAASITSYLWNFGDGYTSTITNPVHTYSQAGSYTVTLKAVAGSEQDIITKTDAISVSAATGAPSTLAGFPSTPVLDDFADAVITDTWAGILDETGAISGFVASGGVLSATRSGDLYWLQGKFGIDQEAFYTLSSLATANGPISLTLKAQDSAGYNRLVARYDPALGQVTVWSVWTDLDTQAVTVTQHGATIPVTYTVGDRFGVRALSYGQVEVYKNGARVGQRDVIAWPYHSQDGAIGLGLSAGDAVDDFGGGSFAPLELNLGASATEVVSSEPVTVTLRVRNASVITLTYVGVTNTVPAGLSYVTGSASSGGVYLTGTQTLSWSLGTLGPSVTTTLIYRATVDPITATRFMTSTGRAAAAELPDGVTGDLVFSAGVVTTDTIAPGGDTVVSADSRLTVTIPSGVFTQTTPITVVTFPSRPAITDTTTAPSVALARYSLDAGAAFTSPVTLTFDLKGLIALNPVTPTGHYVAIGYLEETDDAGQPLTNTIWSLLPVTTESITDSVFSVQATHFSQWGAFSVPAEPNGPTKPAPRLPGIDPFSGGLMFAYPLALPPGRGGLQPELSLMYNSHGANSTGEPADTPMLGTGWSLAVPQITRKIKSHQDNYLTCQEAYGQLYCFYMIRFEYENIYWLSFNGATHRLIPDPAKNGLYYTESDTFLRIRRCDYYAGLCGYVADHTSIPNSSKQFWEVTTKDGTIYRFGYLPESEQIVTMGPYRPYAPSHGTRHQNYDNWAGVLDRQLAYRWRLDLVRDVYGSAIMYRYREEPGSGNWLNGYEASSYLDKIFYGNRTPVDKTYTAAGETYGFWRAIVELAYTDRYCEVCRSGYATGEADSLRDVTAYVLNDSTGIYDVARQYSLGIINGWPTSRLASIIEKGKGAAGPWLATSFDYQAFHNRGCPGGGMDTCNRYPNWRLTSLAGPNGLSASAAYGPYVTWNEWKFWYANRLTLNDGLGNLTISEYAPAGFAWDSDPHVENSPSLGFPANTETVKNAAGVTLAKTIYEFHTGHQLWGREKSTRALRPSDNFMLRQALNTWASPASSPASGVTFARLDKTETGVFDGAQPLTTTVEYKYDAYGNLWAERQRGGSGAGDDRTMWMTYTYNTAAWIIDRVATQRAYAGDSTTEPLALSALAQTLHFYDGATLTTTAPTKGRLTATRTGITNTTTISTGYEATWGNPVVITDARGFTTTIGYDAWGQYPTVVTNALGHRLQLTYTLDFGALITQTDPSGATTAYAYDAHGRLTQIVGPGDSPASPTVVYTYTDNYVSGSARLFRLQTARREVSGQPGTIDSAEFYNGLGQLAQTRSEAPKTGDVLVGMQWYDARGLVVSQTLPYTVTGSVVTFDPSAAAAPGYNRTGYDALGRTVIVTAADGTTATTTYQGFTTIVTDPLGRKRQSIVDAFGQLTQVVEYTGAYAAAIPYATSVYTYDLRGNLIGVRDALSNTTVITYDDLGRKTAMADPDMGAWRYAYDAAGNLISQTDALTQTILFGYDPLGRLITKAYQSDIRPTAPVTYTYGQGGNGIGRRTGITDSTGSQSLAYDLRGRLIAQTRSLNGVPWPYTVMFAYDDLDRQTALTYPDGEVVTTTYNAAGLPLVLGTSLGGNYVSSLYYNANGQVTQMGLGNGLNTTYGYFPLNFRLKTIQTGPIQNLTYGYDRVGNVLAITDTATFSPTAQVQTFAYDPLDRLVRAQAAGGSGGLYYEPYAYNAVGNMTGKGGATYHYSDTLHVHAVTAIITGGQALTYTYDANGNMLQRVELTGAQRITYTHGWDAENRLTVVSMTVSSDPLNTTVTRFVYDGDGARVAQIAPDGATTVYIGELYEEVLPPGVSVAPGAGGASASSRLVNNLWTDRLVAGGVRYFGDLSSRVSGPPATRLSAGLIAHYSGTFASYADFYTTTWPGVAGAFDAWVYSVPNKGAPPGTPHATFGYLDGGINYVSLRVDNGDRVQFPTIGKNDVFLDGGANYAEDGKWFVRFAYKFPASGGYGSTIGVGNGTYTSTLPHPASCNCSDWENILAVHQHDTASSPKYRVSVGSTNVISSATTDTNYHTIEFIAAGGKYYLRYDDQDALLASGAITLTPEMMYLGNPISVGSPGTWQSVMVDYVQAGDPETNPPITATADLPWYPTATPTITLRVQDSEAGLDPASGRYRISTDAGSTWSGWLTATVSGPLGSRLVQTLTVASAGPFLSGTNNRLQIRLTDVVSNVLTATYTVKIGQPPDISIESIAAGPYAYAVGSRVYYNGAQSGDFVVTARVTDTGGGLQYMRFPDTTSSGVFSNNVTLSGTYAWGYNFASPDTFSGTVEVTAANALNQARGAWFTVTVDTVAPVVSVSAPSHVTTGTIPVTWSAADGLAGPTGVYTVSVMTDTGPLQLWLGSVTSTTANFTGELGHTYTFVISATDRVSNTGQVTTTTYAVQATKYYYIGSSRVAMRRTNSVSSTVTYLHTDHLGTVSIATNASAQVLARTLNMPYGSARWSSGAMPTDYGFTGQKEPIGTGLVYLHARYYASFAGRFVSADTIVPKPGNPQTLNRLAYTQNNPLKYNDPTGHDVDCSIADSYCRTFDSLEGFLKAAERDPSILKQVVRLRFETTEDERSSALAKFATYWHDQRRDPTSKREPYSIRTTSLEALARASDFAAILSGGDKDVFMRDMSNVFGRADDGVDGWFLGIPTQVSPEASHSIGGAMNSSGLHPSFADPDPDSDQIHHIWYWIQVAFYRGAGIAQGGNEKHESWILEGTRQGTSQQDWNTGWEASFIGQDIAWSRLSVYDVGDRLRWRFTTAYGTNR